MLRNPAVHRQAGYDDVSEAGQLTSVLMRILDRVEARLVAAGRTVQAATPPPGTP